VALVFALEDEIKDTQSGQFLGIKGISPSIHLEMDMFKNVDGPLDFNDPDESHLAFFKNGNGEHLDPNCLSKIPSNGGWIGFHTTKSNVQDVELQYLAISRLLSVYVENSFRHSITVDIKEDIFNGESNAYWGLLGSTGGVSNKQQVCFDWDTTEQNGGVKYVMPTVFMPNGDNLDDEFFIFTKDGYTIGKMWIYNRWGELKISIGLIHQKAER